MARQALAGMAQLVGALSWAPKGGGLNSRQGTTPGCVFDPQSHKGKQPISVSLSH